MIKRSLYIFNPDHDLALASGNVNYMPPASARQMAADLALLPVWYASPESAVLAPSAYNLDFLREMQQHLSLPVIDDGAGSSFGRELETDALGVEPGFEKKVAAFGSTGVGITIIISVGKIACPFTQKSCGGVIISFTVG